MKCIEDLREKAYLFDNGRIATYMNTGRYSKSVPEDHVFMLHEVSSIEGIEKLISTGYELKRAVAALCSVSSMGEVQQRS